MAITVWTGAADGDWGVAGNWSNGVPVNGDTVYLRDNAVDIDAGLNQAAVTIAQLVKDKSYTGRVGTDAAYLQIGATLVDIGAHYGQGDPVGSDRFKLDLTSADTTVTVHDTCASSAEENLPPVRLLVANVVAGSIVRVLKGTVGIGIEDPSEASELNLVVGYKSSQSSDAVVVCGEGVTVSDLYAYGGKTTVRGTLTTVELYDGEVTAAGAANITTATINDGTFYPDEPAVITTLHCYGGTTDLTRSAKPRTVTSSDYKPGSTIKFDPDVVTFTNPLTALDPVQLTVSEGV